MKTRTRVLLVALVAAAYVLTIIAANWALSHLGTAPTFPGAPHTIRVGFGYTAPSGVIFVAASLVLRDLVQFLTGVRRGKQTLALMLPLIALGAGMAYIVADPKIAAASAIAFTFSELVDFALFTWIAPRWTRAVLAGGIAGAVVDSLIFLHFAFHSFNFWQGQILGKTYGILAATLIVAAYRGRVRFTRRTPVLA